MKLQGISFFLFCILLGLSNHLWAQDPTAIPQEIKGIVMEEGTERPLEGVKVVLKDSAAQLQAFTDADGSLAAKGKQLIELVGDRFLLHLDDAASFAFMTTMETC